MPNMDGKGPQGKGPMTGRGMGNCNTAKDENSNEVNEVARGDGRGCGRGCGRRRLCGRGFFGRRNNSTDNE